MVQLFAHQLIFSVDNSTSTRLYTFSFNTLRCTIFNNLCKWTTWNMFLTVRIITIRPFWDLHQWSACHFQLNVSPNICTLITQCFFPGILSIVPKHHFSPLSKFLANTVSYTTGCFSAKLNWMMQTSIIEFFSLRSDNIWWHILPWYSALL